MTERVIKFLSSIGYEASGADIDLITSLIERVADYIKNFCNIREIPESLFSAVTYLTASRFLKIKRNCVLLKQEGESEPALPLNSLKIGDVSFNFSDGSSPEIKFDSFINELENKGRSELYCCRKIRW